MSNEGRKDVLHKALVLGQTVVNAQIEQLGQAYSLLKGEMQVTAVSSVYVTSPLDSGKSQGQLSAVFVVLTDMGVLSLGEKIVQSTQRLPKTSELKLLLYEDETLLVPHLTIPHPELHTRPEWLIPAAEVWPDFIHPVLGVSLQELTAREDWGLWGQFFAQGASLADYAPQASKKL